MVSETTSLTKSADPDQTAPKEQSDQGLHYLLRHFGICFMENMAYIVGLHQMGWSIIFKAGLYVIND